jgi:hypothetical protein
VKHELNADDRASLVALHQSLYQFPLADVEAAIAAGIPRLAFIGAAAWLDAASGLYNAPQVRFELEQRIRKFAKAYAPAYARHARKLAKGVRHAQLHEYKTQSVALTHNDPEQHLRFSVNGELILNVNSLAPTLIGLSKGFGATSCMT